MNFKVIGKIAILLSFLLLASVLVYVYTFKEMIVPKETDASEEMDVSGEPIQNPYSGESFIINSYGILSKYIGGVYVLTPVATYEISAKVVSKLPYHDENVISPIDLCMVWGEMADDKYDGFITYGQSLRYCFYQYNGQVSFTRDYMQSHVSNNHIIPVNDSILEAIKTIEEGNRVTIKGYLVDVSKSKFNGVWTWKTSQTRFDKGSGACEIIYVTEVRKK